MTPKVSVCMITYNHEKYIAQAIESVMMQVTDFDYELVIGDDCSIDKTREICIVHQNKYPDKIVLLLPDRNNGPNKNFISTYLTCSGEYVALLEGDDYWIDSYKLQKQVNYLDHNPHVSVGLHNGNIEENGVKVGKAQGDSFQIYSVKNVINSRVLAPTASYLFRNSIQFPPWFQKVYGGDYALLFLLANLGEIHYLPEVMCVYRRNRESLEGTYRNRPLEKASRDINDFKIYLSIVAPQYREIILKKIIWCYFYRIVKGVQSLKILSIPPDVFFLIKYFLLLLVGKAKVLL